MLEAELGSKNVINSSANSLQLARSRLGSPKELTVGGVWVGRVEAGRQSSALETKRKGGMVAPYS